MALREALDVQLVDHRIAPGRARRAVLAPAERRVDHLAAAEAGADLSLDQLRVWIEQQPARIEAVAAVLRPMHAIRVQKPRACIGQVAVPDEVGALANL